MSLVELCVRGIRKEAGTKYVRHLHVDRAALLEADIARALCIEMVITRCSGNDLTRAGYAQALRE